MKPRLFSTLRRLRHENPLGLPRSGAPPQLPRMQRGLPQKRHIKDVKHIIAVSSAKGGVGKSTIAVNLALSFARLGHRTGILDTDIFGPSIPTLLNLSGEPRLSDNNQLLPLSNYGLQSMSMGYLIPASSPIAWRGLMVQKALQQLLHEVQWSPLDILILDLPPGTGDVQLTIVQQLHLSGSIIVSTPQDLSLIDAIKGIELFKKTDVPILGLVCNMSNFTCPGCGGSHPVFGDMEKIRRVCEERDIRLLGEIPLDARICADADRGKPTVVAEPDSARARGYSDIAKGVGRIIGLGG
ncbi:P-loop containing nucleoside triphosphate hydrolase protein [Clohesyomyces aquaticus]|uniref:p-loop containing nucleoside triphosphate hydrolase protein n=1 Tax=Clohesyomyces aquaticus TaxID=1231657 RepID=A0A1Y1Z3T3_9PLEO|nr:P-loop containing nucleoside triphosphate hydrolase protein [Clohesyomyces aquaticus]